MCFCINRCRLKTIVSGTLTYKPLEDSDKVPGFFPNNEDSYAPVFLPDGIELIHGDAFAILPSMADESCDVVITDPPYSSSTHDGARTGSWSQGGDSPHKLLTFNSITPEQFVEFAKQAVRVSKRWVITFCDWRYAHLLEDIGLVRLGCWTKVSPAPQFTGDRPAQGWEAIAILHRPGKKRWNGGGRAAVWRYNKVRAEHSAAQKPLSLMRDLVRLFSDPGETILDPFCGGATTLVAAMQTGRKAIGIEKDQKQFEVAQNRVFQRK